MKKSYIILFIITFMATAQADIYKGVDLSYVNELEDCGAVYSDNNITKDPYQIMADHGANLIRVRIWHDPTIRSANPSAYSGYDDVVKSIQRAKNLGLRVLLDFHYSDNWTDPGEQEIPHAWSHLAADTNALSTEVYNYTYQVLTDLDALGLMPELVQVGNEINGNIMSAHGDDLYPVDFSRQATLLNSGASAVRAAGANSTIQPKIILHVADPNEADSWVNSLNAAQTVDYDVIGLSFYPEWHAGSVDDIGTIMQNLKSSYNKEVMIVEVGAPWTTAWHDSAQNMMSVLPAAYGAPSISGQRDFLVDLATKVHDIGGYGVIYWEPSWVSTASCNTQWGTGSHWENATFYDFTNNLIPNGGIQFLEQTYGNGVLPATSNNVTFRVDMNNTSATSAYITGTFSGDTSWQLIPMENEGNGVFSYSTSIDETSVGAYYFLSSNDWNNRELVPTNCALQWTTDRQYDINAGKNLFAYTWQSCTPLNNTTFTVNMNNSSASSAFITGTFTDNNGWQLIEMADQGNGIFSFSTYIAPTSQGAYYFLQSTDWNSREVVPTSCALQWGTDREYNLGNANNAFYLTWETCL